MAEDNKSLQVKAKLEAFKIVAGGRKNIGY